MVMCTHCGGNGFYLELDKGEVTCILCHGKKEVTRWTHIKHQAKKKFWNYLLIAFSLVGTLLYLWK